MTVRVGVDVGGTFTDFVLFDQASGQLREFELASTRGLDEKKPVHASCIMQHLQRVSTSSAGRSCGAGRAAGPSRSGPRRTVAGVSRELTRSLAIDSYILHRASARYQNSRHGERIHAIATGREHRWSGWAGLHRHRSTACRLTNHVVNADAGNQFIAPSSQHPSHMQLNLERP